MVLVDELLREAKVAELHVALRVEEDVLRLEVAPGDVVAVEVLEAQRDAAEVEPRRPRVEAAERAPEPARLLLALVHEAVEVAARGVLDGEVDEVAVLERAVEADDERVVELLDAVALREERLLLLRVRDGLLRHGLERHELVGVLVLDEEHAAEAALAQERRDLELRRVRDDEARRLGRALRRVRLRDVLVGRLLVLDAELVLAAAEPVADDGLRERLTVAFRGPLSTSDFSPKHALSSRMPSWVWPLTSSRSLNVALVTLTRPFWMMKSLLPSSPSTTMESPRAYSATRIFSAATSMAASDTASKMTSDLRMRRLTCRSIMSLRLPKRLSKCDRRMDTHLTTSSSSHSAMHVAARGRLWSSAISPK